MPQRLHIVDTLLFPRKRTVASLFCATTFVMLTASAFIYIDGGGFRQNANAFQSLHLFMIALIWMCFGVVSLIPTVLALRSHSTERQRRVALTINGFILAMTIMAFLILML